MNGLRAGRLILASLFLAESVAFLTLQAADFPAMRVAERMQIIPSAIAMSIGATLFWIVMTFLFGRLYCSTVCPVGTILDIPRWVRKKLPGRKPVFRYQPRRHTRRDLLIIYFATLLIGFLPVAWLIEPWNMARNMGAIVKPADIHATWGTLSHGMTIGIIAGIITLIGLLVWGWFSGRRFCSQFCPIGTALGTVEPMTLFHIEIDPDRCTNCLRCEEVCPSECIKIVGRYVDNSRCVRCFACLDACRDDAIRYQANRNRPATPLMRRRAHR